MTLKSYDPSIWVYRNTYTYKIWNPLGNLTSTLNAIKNNYQEFTFYNWKNTTTWKVKTYKYVYFYIDKKYQTGIHQRYSRYRNGSHKFFTNKITIYKDIWDVFNWKGVQKTKNYNY